jgi:hypothetical protein
MALLLSGAMSRSCYVARCVESGVLADAIHAGLDGREGCAFVAALL